MTARSSSASRTPSLSPVAEDTTKREAILSDCGRYRYVLSRSWDPAKPAVVFVMLNPSTADARFDDPTIRRCVGFARAWGYGKLLVGNLYALRATDPDELAAADDPVGPENAYWLNWLRRCGDITVAAWGAHKMAAARQAEVMDLLGGLHALRVTAKGMPGHPLYLPGDLTPTRWTYA